MPQIPTYDDRILPQGSLNVQANADAFGAGIGQAVQQLGNSVGDVGKAIHAVQEDQNRVWAYNATSTVRDNIRNQFDAKVNALNPDAPGFSDTVAKLSADMEEEVRKAKDDLMSKAPSRSAQRMVASHMVSYGEHLNNYARAEQSRVVGEMTGEQVSSATKRAQDAVAADPSNQNAKQVAGDHRQFITGLTSVDPALKAKWATKSDHELAVTQVQVLSATRSKEFLSMVHAQGGRITPGGTTKGAVPGGPGATGNAPTPGAAPAAPAPLDVEALAPHLVNQESGGNQAAVSSKGAIGRWQVMPGTGPEAAKLAGLPWDEKRLKTDAAYNEALGKAYLGQQLKTFDGDAAKALAAYNAGPGAVQKAVKRWQDQIDRMSSDPSVSVEALNKVQDGDLGWMKFLPKPEETVPYVTNILAGANAAQAPQAQAKAALGLTDSNPLPQVDPLTEQDIAASKPDIWGWDKLTWPEKVAMVRQAENAMGGQLAKERGEIIRDLKDIEATHRDGKDYPGLDSPKLSQENLVRVLGPVDGKRAADQIKFSYDVKEAMKTVNTAPVAQVERLAASLEPKGGSEYADKRPVYEAFVKAVDNVQRARNNDYVQWALDAGVGSAKPLDFGDPAKLAAGLRARVPLANTGVTDYQADAHVLSKQEAAQLGDMMNRLNPQDQIAYLKALKTGVGTEDRWFHDALTQIAPKNTMLAFSAEASMRKGSVQVAGGAQDGDTVAKYILEGAHILQGKDLNDPEKTGRPLAIDDKQVRQDFWSVVGPDAFASPDAQRSAAMANDTYQAVKNYLAADIYHRGQDPKTITRAMVENAVKAVTGGTVKSPQGDALFLPWGMEEKAFHQNFPRALNVALTNSGIKGTQLDAPDGFHYANLDEGRYLVMNGNRQPLYGKNGRPVVVDLTPYDQKAAPSTLGGLLPLLTRAGK